MAVTRGLAYLGRLAAEQPKSKTPDNDKERAACPLKWIRDLRSPGARGSAGAQLMRDWLSDCGLTVGKSHTTEADLIVEGFPVEVKLSFRTPDHQYSWMQIRSDQDWRFAILLGVGPDQAQVYIVPHALAVAYSRPQHGGIKGDGKVRCLIVKCDDIPAWLRPLGGQVENVRPRGLLGLGAR